MSRGIIEAQTLRSEQFEFEARTSDPTDAQPGEYWIRVDQTGTNPDVIAELRRQDNSGVTTCPIFAEAEESNLGADVTRGPSVVLDDGSVGFIVMTTRTGAVGSPRAVNSAGTQYVSHNALELSPIPDSGVSRWTLDDADTSIETALDVWGSNDGSISGASTGVSGANQTYTTNEAYSFDGQNDRVDWGPMSEVIGAAEVSFSAWAKFPSTSVQGLVFGAYPSPDDGLFMGVIDGGYWARVENSTTRAEYQAGPHQTGSWIHLVMTYNSGSLTLYVDGGVEGSDTGGPSYTATNLGDFYSAYSVSLIRNDLQADIDDIRVYDKELSSNEVSDLYNTGSI